MNGKQQYPSLRGREKADVAIVGGGLTGITTALWLSRAGLRVALAEARTIGCGASGHEWSVLSPAHQLLYAKLKTERGINAAEACAETRTKAIREVRKLSNQWQIPLVSKPAFLVTQGSADALEEEMKVMKDAGLQVIRASSGEIPFHAKAALKLPTVYVMHREQYFHALTDYVMGLKARLFEDSRVTAVEQNVVYTETGSIRASSIVIATGYPIINIPGWFFMRLEQRNIRSFHIRQTGKAICFAADGSFAFLPTENGAVIRTADSSGISSCDDWLREEVFQTENKSRMYTETYTPDGLPYIGMYSSQTPNLLTATGYGGEGVTGSMIAARAIRAKILGLPSDEYDIYSPQRKMNGLTLPVRMGGKYLKGLLVGKETPRCSHMGCRLVFNPETRLWECPCHGSRFDEIGRVINAPAIKPAILRGRK